jgi:hypothetical protein
MMKQNMGGGPDGDAGAVMIQKERSNQGGAGQPGLMIEDDIRGVTAQLDATHAAVGELSQDTTTDESGNTSVGGLFAAMGLGGNAGLMSMLKRVGDGPDMQDMTRMENPDEGDF